MTSSVTDFDFDSKVLGSKNLVLVDFWAEWCGPCRQLGPTIDEIAMMYDKKDCDVYKMNIDENPGTPSIYGVRSIPTLMLFKNGKHISTKVGALPKSQIISWIDEYK